MPVIGKKKPSVNLAAGVPAPVVYTSELHPTHTHQLSAINNGNGSYTVSLVDLVSLYVAGIIQPDVENRGGTKVNAAFVDEMVENFQINALGIIHMSVNGTVYTLCDAHTRMAALEKLFHANALDPKLWVDIRVYDDPSHIYMYSILNRHKPHTASNKNMHTGMFYGFQTDYLKTMLINNGLNQDQSKQLVYMVNKMANKMAHVIEATRREENFSKTKFYDIFDQRKYTVSLQGMAAADPRVANMFINLRQMQQIGDGLFDVLQVFEQTLKLGKSQGIRSIVESGSFAAFLLIQYLGKTSCVYTRGDRKRSYKALATKIVNNDRDINIYKALTGGGPAMSYDNEAQLRKIFA